jgi:hypothetical protein
MPAKVGVAIAGVALAMFVAGRAGLGHSPLAWAQAAQNQAQDQAPQDQAAQDQAADLQDYAAAPRDADASPDEAPAQSDADDSAAKPKPTPKPTPATASGVYSGTVMDANHGAGVISAAISQIRTKIIGTWQDTFVPPAFIAGTINSKGQMALRMRFYLKGNCGYVFTGSFKNGNEISGSYKLSGCARGVAADHGTLDMFKQ